jgi:hypothetical protein
VTASRLGIVFPVTVRLTPAELRLCWEAAEARARWDIERYRGWEYAPMPGRREDRYARGNRGELAFGRVIEAPPWRPVEPGRQTHTDVLGYHVRTSTRPRLLLQDRDPWDGIFIAVLDSDMDQVVAGWITCGEGRAIGYRDEAMRPPATLVQVADLYVAGLPITRELAEFRRVAT